MLVAVGVVFYRVVLPLLLLVGIGYWLQKRFGMEMATLVRLNFYVSVPAIVFFSIVRSELGQAGLAIGFTVLVMIFVGALTLAGAVALKVPKDQWRAMLLGTVFYNTGNFSMPLQNFAWRETAYANAAMGMQAFIMVGQNLIHFTWGVMLAAGGGNRWREQVRTVATFPPLWAGVVGVAVVAFRENVSPEVWQQTGTALRPFWDVVDIARQSFMAVALVAMGAQIASVEPGFRDNAVIWSVACRNILSPVVGLLCVWALGLRGPTAQILVISSAAPSAVNSVLLSLQFKNHPKVVARTVFASTILSPITTTLVIWAAQSGLLV